MKMFDKKTKHMEINMNGKEYLKFLNRKPQIKINFPKLEQRHFYIVLLIFAITTLIVGVLMYNLGEKSGSRYGYSKGYDSGEKVCLRDSYEGLSLKSALAYNLKYNLNKYIGWFGLVVGLAWVFHGVGFFIVRG